MKASLKTKLRIRFVLFSMLGIFLILSGIVSVSIWNNYRDMVEKSDIMISQIHNNSSAGVRYFSVKIPAGTDMVYPDVVQHVSVTVEDATGYAQQVLKDGKDAGFMNGYRYRIYRNENGIRIYFLYRASSIEMCKTAGENLILISLLGLIIIGALLIPVSGWVVSPLLENHKKQKAFITSASHELKTPLTVISTNAQLLEMEIGDNEWLRAIQNQTEHLTQMTHALVLLSKAEEYDNPLKCESFSLGESAEDITETYAVIAKQKSVELDWNVEKDLQYSGNKTEIMQLIRILLDNACKYCPENGCIHLVLKRHQNGVQLHICNTSEILPADEVRSLPLRFHRGGNANSMPGFGLGLSIAEAIAKRHNGKMTVSAAENEFSVEVTLR